MNYSYRIESDISPELFVPVIGIILLVVLAASLVFYIFQSLGLYTLAKRRGIRYPGLAWVPVGNIWIMGCVADQYDSVTRRKRSRQRHILLWLFLGLLAVFFVIYAFMFSYLFTILPQIANGTYYGTFPAYAYRYFPFILIGYLFILGISITYLIFQYIALYKLYKSCNPDTAIAFLLLSIFISVTMPFLVFAGRKKDLGMVPFNGMADRSL